MKLIQGNIFKIKGIEYKVVSIEFKEGKRYKVNFKSNSWDKEVTHYSMSADEFDCKVSFEQYVSLT